MDDRRSSPMFRLAAAVRAGAVGIRGSSLGKIPVCLTPTSLIGENDPP
jgi:hypothetical protein